MFQVSSEDRCNSKEVVQLSDNRTTENQPSADCVKMVECTATRCYNQVREDELELKGWVAFHNYSKDSLISYYTYCPKCAKERGLL
jgi:hypothetical protein